MLMRYGTGFSVKCRRPDSMKSQVSPSKWPGQAFSPATDPLSANANRHGGAELLSGFAVMGGNLSNTQEGWSR